MPQILVRHYPIAQPTPPSYLERHAQNYALLQRMARRQQRIESMRATVGWTVAVATLLAGYALAAWGVQ